MSHLQLQGSNGHIIDNTKLFKHCPHYLTEVFVRGFALDPEMDPVGRVAGGGGM